MYEENNEKNLADCQLSGYRNGANGCMSCTVGGAVAENMVASGFEHEVG